MLELILGLMLALPPGGAAPSDTVALPVGSPLVDGRIYKPHLAAVLITTTRGGQVIRTLRYTNDLYVERRGNVPVYRLESKPVPEEADQSFYAQVILGQRTLELLHIEQRDGSGRHLVADVDGTHVTGTTRSGADTTTRPLDFTLDPAGYLLSFLDSAVNATEIREGRVFKIPAFDFTGRKTDWLLYRVVGRDTVRTGAHPVPAWVIEVTNHPRLAGHKIWLTREPPYLPLVITTLKDGTVSRFESTLIRNHK